jgi:DNA-binding NarL/FixJ family response regulator
MDHHWEQGARLMSNAETQTAYVGGVAQAADGQEPHSADADRPVVVVVDDQSAGRRLLTQVIRDLDADIDVRAFADAASALDLVAQMHVDLIVTDYLMPGMDGRGFIRRLRTLPGREDLPVLVVTVAEDRQIRYDALEAGATDFLSRPIDEQECRARCRNLLALGRSHQELRRRGEQLARLSGELSLTEQRERRRLAKIIHDDLQQLLVAAALSVQRARKRLPESQGAAEPREALATASDLLQQASDVARGLVGDLAPPILHDAGLAEALEWLARRYQERYGLRVSLDLDDSVARLPDDLRSVLFDGAREALFNVVKHAGTQHAQLALFPSDDERLHLVVEDDGVGFDAAAWAAGRSGEEDGFGLFSTRERLRLLGGECRAFSKPGSGTRVDLTVPLAHSARQPKGLDGVATDAAGARGPATSAPGAARAVTRILLVDDHAMMRRALSSMLAGEPGLCISGEAADGVEAIAEVERTQPDVVLMDLSMPRMDGLEATRRIMQRWPQIRIIGLSMHERADRARAMLDAGAVGYVCKTSGVGELLEIIRRVSAVDTAAVAVPAAVTWSG